MLYSFHWAVFSCCTFFVLHSLYVALFSCCTLSTLYLLYCTLFVFRQFFFSLFMFQSCCTFFVMHSFNVLLFLSLFMFLRVSLFHSFRVTFKFNYFGVDFLRIVFFSCCTLSVLQSFHVLLFACCTTPMLLFCAALSSCCTFFVLHSFHVGLPYLIFFLEQVLCRKLLAHKLGWF